MTGGADISACGRYRYRLWRDWGNGLWEGPGPTYRVLFIMLNPSTADAATDDPTIRKCIGFAKTWGYGGMTVVNLFPLRATDPAELTKQTIGPEAYERNWRVIDEALKEHVQRIAAWGTKAIKIGGGVQVAAMLSKLGRTARCLRRSNDGQPWHPLYVPYSACPLPLVVDNSIATIGPSTGGDDNGRE